MKTTEINLWPKHTHTHTCVCMRTYTHKTHTNTYTHLRMGGASGYKLQVLRKLILRVQAETVVLPPQS